MSVARGIGRFAPSTTGPAHPGTLMAGLLCWLDARHRNLSVGLRLEDLDPARCKPAFADEMRAALEWVGLDWDSEELQSENRAAHEAALDQLAAEGLLYPCHCSRADLRERGQRTAAGHLRYPGTCRVNRLPSPSQGGWRGSEFPLRVALPTGSLALRDESGLDLSQDPAEEVGDPVVRRRDGAVAYQLASVVDDAEAGVTHVVRGRDLAPSTATQVRLAQMLERPEPTYRHHLLLLEPRGDKLAKLHGSVSWEELQASYSGAEWLGWMAQTLGLMATAKACRPRDLVDDFSWDRVESADIVVHFRPGMGLSTSRSSNGRPAPF